MKNIFYLSGAIAFAIISFHFVTIQIKTNSETCKYLAKKVDTAIHVSEIADGVSEPVQGISEPVQGIKEEIAMRAKQYSEIYNDYCKF